MQRTLQQRAREAADRIRCDECGEQRTCTPLMAKACLKGFIRGYVEAKELSASDRNANGIGSMGVKYTWGQVLPLSKITERLVGTTKSYEQLIKELDNEQGKD